MIEVLVSAGLVYLVMGFFVWAFIFSHGGFLMPDGKTPAPFWHCMFMTIIMWPAALNRMELL